MFRKWSPVFGAFNSSTPWKTSQLPAARAFWQDTPLRSPRLALAYFASGSFHFAGAAWERFRRAAHSRRGPLPTPVEMMQYAVLATLHFSSLPVAAVRDLLLERECVVSGFTLLPEELFAAFVRCSPEGIRANISNRDAGVVFSGLLEKRRAAGLTALRNSATEPNPARRLFLLSERKSPDCIPDSQPAGVPLEFSTRRECRTGSAPRIA